MRGDTERDIDPDDLAAYRRVLARLDDLPVEHPDAVEVRRATASLFNAVKDRRRAERRRAVVTHDRAVTAATATGTPGRIDDGTRGLELMPDVDDASAGELRQPRGCYVCKTRYTRVDAFYHQLCPGCAAENRARRDARTDLSGRRALLTGGRAKIGMHIALRLLRDGAETTITTRFPRDAARRFAAMPDSAEWLNRLRVIGVDLRDPAQAIALADSMIAEGSLDILINNAAQTVRRSAASYALLAAAEAAPLPSGPLPELSTLGSVGSSAAIPASANSYSSSASPAILTELSLAASSVSSLRVAAGVAIDAGGLIPDPDPVNSWTQTVEHVDPVELAASPARRTYVVNVSAMEGQFNRGYKGPGHPHTNMAKAALNMLTRTSAHELLTQDGILMTSVDTGWITDERPVPTKLRLADAGFHAPLDLVDGAARVYDPIVRGEAGEDLYGCFLKDYQPAPW
jgi:NAD(P)-dependent dehydrogenase (short-subunit alcohol dehydrogenase family)